MAGGDYEKQLSIKFIFNPQRQLIHRTINALNLNKTPIQNE